MMNRLFAEANIGEEFRQARFANFRTEPGTEAAQEACLALVECWPPTEGLLMYGMPGGGKSRLAATVVGELLDRGIPAVYQSVSELYKRIKRTYEAGAGETETDIYWGLIHAPLLALDDVGAQHIARKDDGVAWAEEQLYAIVDARVRHRRPMVITANIDLAKGEKPGRLEGIIGARSYSRIVGACRFVAVTAQDYRRMQGLQRIQAVQEEVI